MDIMLIDFDAQFSQYMKKWLKDNTDKYKNLDEVEEMMPKIYENWLNSPQDFLSGKKPGEYFFSFSAKDLIALMLRYESKNIGVPDPLLDAVSSKKEEALPYLADIALGRTAIPSGADICAVKITALNLIDEIDPSKYGAEYVAEMLSGALDEGVMECMAESLKQSGDKHMDVLTDALLKAQSDSVKNTLIDILCVLPYHEKVYNEIVNMFNTSGDKALFASYLGKYGNPEAVQTLKSALDWININYLDYIEIRNAIEELGEEVSHSREFDGDKYYESMKGL